MDHPRQIIVSVTAAKGLAFVSAIIMCSLANVSDDDYFASAQMIQNQIIVALIEMSDQHCIDWDGHKTICRAHSLDQLLGYNLAENPEDYPHLISEGIMAMLQPYLL